MTTREGIVSAATLMHDGGMLYSIVGNAPLQLSSVLELELYDKVEMDDGAVLKSSKASHRIHSTHRSKFLSRIGKSGLYFWMVLSNSLKS